MRANGHLGRSFLLGTDDDATNVILAAAGHNLRLLRAWLTWLLAFLLSTFAVSRQTREAHLTCAPDLAPVFGRELAS
jgi:IS5 family transposase